MSLDLEYQKLKTERSKIEKKIEELTSKIDTSVVLQLRFKEYLKTIAYSTKELIKNENDLYPNYFLNEIVIISKLNKLDFWDDAKEWYSKHKIYVGAIVTIDEIGFNDVKYCFVNGLKLNTKDDITISRLNSTLAYFKNKEIKKKSIKI